MKLDFEAEHMAKNQNNSNAGQTTEWVILFERFSLRTDYSRIKAERSVMDDKQRLQQPLHAVMIWQHLQ